MNLKGPFASRTRSPLFPPRKPTYSYHLVYVLPNTFAFVMFLTTFPSKIESQIFRTYLHSLSLTCHRSIHGFGLI